MSHDRAFLDDVVTSTLAIEADGRIKEYDGGYDDYLRQRQAEATAEAKPTTVASARPVAEKARKLGHKERRELDALPARIEELETALRDLHATMADPAFYRRDKAEIAEAKARLEALEAQQATAYARWEELDALS